MPDAGMLEVQHVEEENSLKEKNKLKNQEEKERASQGLVQGRAAGHTAEELL